MFTFIKPMKIEEICQTLKMVKTKNAHVHAVATALFVEHLISVVGESMYIVTCRGYATFEAVSETLKLLYR
jgi:hypothetical protein